jgi:hypothetical protein
MIMEYAGLCLSDLLVFLPFFSFSFFPIYFLFVIAMIITIDTDII